MKNIILTILMITAFKALSQDINQKRIPIGTFQFIENIGDARSYGIGKSKVGTQNDYYYVSNNFAKAPTILSDTLKTLVNVNYHTWERIIINDMYGLNFQYSTQIDDNSNENGNYVFADLKYFNQDITEQFNFQNEFIGVTYNSEMMLGIGYVKQIKRHSFGGSLNLVESKISTSVPGLNDLRAFNFSINYFNSGFDYYKDSWLSWGICINNLGPKVKYGEGDNKFTNYQNSILKLGGSWYYHVNRNNKISLNLDLNKLLVPTPLDGFHNIKDQNALKGIFSSFSDAPEGFKEELQEIQISTGIELIHKDFLFARAGYYYRHKMKGDIHLPTFGLGIHRDQLRLDASYLFNNKKHPTIISNAFIVSAALGFKPKKENPKNMYTFF